ncbi:hypothetical protein [Sphingomonas endophytica]|uniref:hypothetical protein n=1 Tax=Sphingomonas endophytica TaxID=869719 RepID=UPI00315B2F84
MPALPEGPIGAETPLTRMGATLHGMEAELIYLSSSPLYHAAPLRWAMAAQQLGGTVIVMERFDAEGYVAADRAASRHPCHVRADAFCADAEAAPGGVRAP